MLNEKSLSGKHYRTAALVLCSFVAVMTAPLEKQQLSVGLNFFLGGRYDNLRMCVATPAGVKGGPIADMQLVLHYGLNNRMALGMKVPIMRPVLFGLAFKMVQIEPEFTMQYRMPVKKRIDVVLEPSVGVSFHYGPDYKTARNDPHPESFFAAGPMVALLGGIGWHNDSGRYRCVGLKPFYIPLFSRKRTTGTVLGVVAEGYWDIASIK